MSDSEEVWTPCEDLLENYKQVSYAVVILNCPISENIDHRKIYRLWTHAKVRVAVDGGAKRWLSWLQTHEYDESDIAPPELITGDMDSLDPEILDYFISLNTQLIKTPDQNSTDFTKSLQELKVHCLKKDIQIDTIFVLADTSGRFDQIMANINTLYTAANFWPEVKIYQFACTSLSWVLTSGRHRISIPENLRAKEEWCALIPIGQSAVASSTGLKWNLENRKLQFGGMVSTSNTYDGDPFVTIKTDTGIVWSMGIEAIL